MKLAMRSGTHCFVAINTSRNYNAQRWLLAFHHAHLYAAGMRTQNHIRVFLDKKCVLHITRRMLRRNHAQDAQAENSTLKTRANHLQFPVHRQQ